MDEHDMAILEARRIERQGLPEEERRTRALEEISDSLYGLVAALHRIADNVA